MELAGGDESVKKKKIWDKNFFQIMLNEIVESCENGWGEGGRRVKGFLLK